MSTRQQATVLEVIAARMSTLNDLLMMAQCQTDDYEKAVLVDAAQSMAVCVCAMADDATGGGVRGDMKLWLYGPSFRADVNGPVEATQGGAA
ncbi:hypothetical protein [Acidovorax sp.]|uniref:hypothetical protein n=1 Tax=Acidovorax sp. TaxID=1872122 RepID=UPI002FA41C3E